MKSSSHKRPHLPLPPLERAFTLKTQYKNPIKQRQDKVRAYVSKQFRSHHDLWKHPRLLPQIMSIHSLSRYYKTIQLATTPSLCQCPPLSITQAHYWPYPYSNNPLNRHQPKQSHVTPISDDPSQTSFPAMQPTLPQPTFSFNPFFHQNHNHTSSL